MDTYSLGAFCINGTRGEFSDMLFTAIGFGDGRSQRKRRLLLSLYVGCPAICSRFYLCLRDI